MRKSQVLMEVTLNDGKSYYGLEHLQLINYELIVEIKTCTAENAKYINMFFPGYTKEKIICVQIDAKKDIFDKIMARIIACGDMNVYLTNYINSMEYITKGDYSILCSYLHPDQIKEFIETYKKKLIIYANVVNKFNLDYNNLLLCTRLKDYLFSTCPDLELIIGLFGEDSINNLIYSIETCCFNNNMELFTKILITLLHRKKIIYPYGKLLVSIISQYLIKISNIGLSTNLSIQGEIAYKTTKEFICCKNILNGMDLKQYIPKEDYANLLKTILWVDNNYILMKYINVFNFYNLDMNELKKIIEGGIVRQVFRPLVLLMNNLAEYLYYSHNYEYFTQLLNVILALMIKNSDCLEALKKHYETNELCLETFILILRKNVNSDIRTEFINCFKNKLERFDILCEINLLF